MWCCCYCKRRVGNEAVSSTVIPVRCARAKTGLTSRECLPHIGENHLAEGYMSLPVVRRSCFCLWKTTVGELQRSKSLGRINDDQCILPCAHCCVVFDGGRTNHIRDLYTRSTDARNRVWLKFTSETKRLIFLESFEIESPSIHELECLCPHACAARRRLARYQNKHDSGQATTLSSKEASRILRAVRQAKFRVSKCYSERITRNTRSSTGKRLSDQTEQISKKKRKEVTKLRFSSFLGPESRKRQSRDFKVMNKASECSKTKSPGSSRRTSWRLSEYIRRIPGRFGSGSVTMTSIPQFKIVVRSAGESNQSFKTKARSIIRQVVSRMVTRSLSQKTEHTSQVTTNEHESCTSRKGSFLHPSASTRSSLSTIMSYNVAEIVCEKPRENSDPAKSDELTYRRHLPPHFRKSDHAKSERVSPATLLTSTTVGCYNSNIPIDYSATSMTSEYQSADFLIDGSKFRFLQRNGENILVGKGKTGKVYLGLLEALDGRRRKVCIKSSNSNYRHRLFSEYRCLEMLQCTGVVPKIYGILRDGIVMDFIGNGTDLMRLLRQKMSFPVRTWIDVALQLVLAVNKVHQQDVLLNDLKPANVMTEIRSRERRIKITLIDFSHASVGCGLTYVVPKEKRYQIKHIAPEVLDGERTTKESDVYSIGAMIDAIFKNAETDEGWKNYWVYSQIGRCCLVNDQNNRPSTSQLIQAFRKLRCDVSTNRCKPVSLDRPYLVRKSVKQL